MAEKLTEAQIESELANSPEWGETSGEIQRTYQFPDFKASIAFVDALAEYAERVRHHPDILIRYNKVTVSVSTHDAGGITAKDFALAQEADRIASQLVTA
ncbi:MAG TPA: 4a-hydroxytetrahydrobiopterin dehydratase [Phycisphaerales bacterium]|nr:4a-hydroxytetrahydrobiopterin dehydratase [Phycisphaerales bacterium]